MSNEYVDIDFNFKYDENDNSLYTASNPVIELTPHKRKVYTSNYNMSKNMEDYNNIRNHYHKNYSNVYQKNYKKHKPYSPISNPKAKIRGTKDKITIWYKFPDRMKETECYKQNTNIMQNLLERKEETIKKMKILENELEQYENDLIDFIQTKYPKVYCIVEKLEDRTVELGIFSDKKFAMDMIYNTINKYNRTMWVEEKDCNEYSLTYLLYNIDKKQAV